MIAMTISRPKNVRMRPPPAELPLPPAACWLTWSRGRLTGFFSWSAPAAIADSTCHMKVVAATPPARRNRFMEDVRPALEEGGGSGRKTYIGVSSGGFSGSVRRRSRTALFGPLNEVDRCVDFVGGHLLQQVEAAEDDASSLLLARKLQLS